MIEPYINNEFDLLKKVILGIAENFGGVPELQDAYDPKSKEHILQNTYPVEHNLIYELNKFKDVLIKHNVDVLSPENIPNCNQIFTRDVGFVVENQFFISNMISKRSIELNGIKYILKQIKSANINNIPKSVFVEGGDVIVFNNFLFIGYSDSNSFDKYEVSRTNEAALEFFANKFPSKKIIGFNLHKSDSKSDENCLHLDCCFQPLGLGHAILYPGGFKFKEDISFIENLFGKENIIYVDKFEMADMNSNLFSINKNVIVSEKKFVRINSVLRQKGYIVEDIPFSEIAKMGGLLRCTTLPLIRNYE
ncbi:MAG: amidinotransferase [Flavobacteriales bacterium]|nr:amidinotransferase [Flavobacteriales bacterium]|tara:strand:+ start:71 stop:991 length:921 start_codon:yes stop_codon:yes gene_type:complete